VRWAKTPDGKGRVRITPQLVRVADDTPMWSETYDREVTDIFDIQTEIANRVVDALGVTLQAGEREQLGERLTSSLEANELLVRAKTSTCSFFIAGCAEEIVGLLEQALALDPKFLAAWYELSFHHASMYHLDIDRTEARLARAKDALDHAVAIDPEHPFTRLARGFYYYYGFRDYDRALLEFQAVVAERPNDAEAHWAASLIHRRKGAWEESRREMERAIELDPKNSDFLWDLADTYDALRRPELAMKTFERAQAIHDDVGLTTEMVSTILRYSPGTDKGRAVLDRAPNQDDPNLVWAWTNIYLQERNFTKAIELLQRVEAGEPAGRAQVQGFVAIMEALRDGKEKARPSLERAADASTLVARDSPSNAGMRITLAMLYAYLGRADEALREAKVAVDLTAKDMMSAPQALEALAIVYAHLGRADEAVELITRVLGMNYDEPLTVYSLQKDPRWDPLRDNPKFQALLKGSS